MGGIQRNKLKRRLRLVSRVRTWQLVLVLILSLFVFATLLRLDNIKMFELRDAVIEADEAGNMDDILESIAELKKFVFSHTVIAVVEENGQQRIVFGSGPFYLERQYERRAEAALEEAREALASEDYGNNNIYAEVAAFCDNLAIQYGWRSWTKPHLDCYINELAKFPEMQPIIDLKTAMIPATGLYFQNYASPLWAPTWAGAVQLFIIIILIILIVRTISYFALLLAIRLTRGKS